MHTTYHAAGRGSGRASGPACCSTFHPPTPPPRGAARPSRNAALLARFAPLSPLLQTSRRPPHLQVQAWKLRGQQLEQRLGCGCLQPSQAVHRLLVRAFHAAGQAQGRAGQGGAGWRGCWVGVGCRSGGGCTRSVLRTRDGERGRDSAEKVGPASLLVSRLCHSCIK